MTHTKTVTVGKTSSSSTTGSQAAERARITAEAKAQRERAAAKGSRTGEVSRGGAVIRAAGGAKVGEGPRKVSGGSPAQTAKPKPPVPVIDPYRPLAPAAKLQLILSRTDGTRIMTGSNVVKQGDTVLINVVNGPPGAACRLKYGKAPERGMVLTRSGTGTAGIIMGESGNIGVNLLVPSGKKTSSGAVIYDTHFEAVWVAAPSAPALPETVIPVSQTVTPATSQQLAQTSQAGPSFLDQLGQAGEQAKVGFGGFGVGVIAAGILGVLLLFGRKRVPV